MTASSDISDIKKFNDQFIAAFNARDRDTLAKGHTDDAVLMPPGVGPVKGLKAIKQVHLKLIEVLHDVSNVVEDVQVIGDVAVQRGTYRLAMNVEGKDVQGSGAFMDVLRRQTDGRWKYSHSIWNSDQK